MISEQFANDGCPDEWTLSRFAENRLESAAAGEVLAHVAGCMRCRTKIKDFAEWLTRLDNGAPAEKDLSQARKAWLRMQWRRVSDRFKPRTEFLAAADGQTGNERQTKNAMGSGFIHFLSRTPRGLKSGWHVKLSIPACPTEKTILRMAVLDGTDQPIPVGTLHFCRMSLPVVDGKASLPLVDFQRNMSEAFISLRREDGLDMPGDPALGYDLML